MSQFTDDTFQQVRIATDDLIKHMAKFNAALEDAKRGYVGKRRGDYHVIGEADAEMMAMQTKAVKDAISDCHWAATRLNAFGTAYLCGMVRQDELRERHASSITLSDI